MKKYLVGAGIILALAGCGGQLSKEEAGRLIRSQYEGDRKRDCAGCSQVRVTSLSIDSIRQQDARATVYFRVAGETSNGSAYPGKLDEAPNEMKMHRSLSGAWRCSH